MAVDMIARMMAMGNGGGSGDAYTKAETDQLLDGKADLVDGKIPAAQLPSYVDDVLEYASVSAFPATGESGKIYISTDTNKTYRWGGSAYVEISESLALGETASTAYPGNKGKANADAIAAIKDGTNIDSFADVETALAAKLNTADVDVDLSSTSTNPVQNKAVQAPMATLIDNGAKNLFNQSESYGLNNVSNDNGVYTTSGDTLTTLRLQIAKCRNGSRVEDLAMQSITSNGVYYWEFTKYSSFDSFMIGHNGSTYNGLFMYDLGKLENGRSYVIRIDITRCSDSNGSFQWRNIMICTAKDWAVSQEFVPFAMSNRELYNDVNVLNQRIESFVYNPSTSKSIILSRASSATFLALGFVQGIGNIYWILEIDGSGNLTVKNGFDGSTVSAAGISFNKDTKTLTFTSQYNGNSNITIIMTSV